MQHGIAKRQTAVVVIPQQFIDRIDLGHAGDEHTTAVDAELVVIGNVNVMPFSMQDRLQCSEFAVGVTLDVPVMEFEIGPAGKE